MVDQNSASEPMSDIYFPIIDDLSRVELTDDPQAQNVVGLLCASFYWREMVLDILPEGSDGIDIVVDNACAGSFTYRINGRNASFVGAGDRHDPAYDGLMESERLVDIISVARHESEYSGPPLDSEFCPIKLRIYPSNDMKSRFTTKNRKIFTAAAVFIFAFTSLIFLLYDKIVERRQQTVLKTAVDSTAIVSSLFPSDVRNRLYDERQMGRDGAKKTNTSFQKDEKNDPELQHLVDKADIFSTSPNADVYPETTVLFADIAGFTGWSSERQPTQVFRLLENLYYAFDRIAKERRVFKVETIGDCYVAVVGLPTPRRHHAVVAARFADAIQAKMGELVLGLEKSLGAVRNNNCKL
jgi:Adenylate and Guanylate cyclase catalytic domain